MVKEMNEKEIEEFIRAGLSKENRKAVEEMDKSDYELSYSIEAMKRNRQNKLAKQMDTSFSKVVKVNQETGEVTFREYDFKTGKSVKSIKSKFSAELV